ncbi:hypothetical protein NBRC116594_30370 [Shimia sp. NS0008-38b]|uniref:luciferase domain-containing protein n=1 Tax=Shimia sp. NS0008-38b TaxID=3127653 RepID=UPI0031078E51
MTHFRSLSTVLLGLCLSSTVSAQGLSLPERQGPQPETTSGVPHIQIGVLPKPELSEELLRRVDALPGVDLGATRVSLPGAVGFQLSSDMFLARPEVIVGGREFAHLHPDGSLHASLTPEIAQAAIEAGWAVAHPWAQQRDGWEGFVMIYTPKNKQELEVVYDLVKASYSFVSGVAVR